MALPDRWDALAAIEACKVGSWHGHAWRGHHKRYAADDSAGARLTSGRYHRGLDLFPRVRSDGSHKTRRTLDEIEADWALLSRGMQVWAALYLGLTYGVCVLENLRHMPRTAPELEQFLRSRRYSRLEVQLTAVVDCLDLAVLGIPRDDLQHATDYAAGQALGAAVRRKGHEAMLMPSATGAPDPVLILFPENYRAGSVVRVVDFFDPPL